MPRRPVDDWSEDEDEDDSVNEIETSVLLGIPDGEITESLDLLDPAVSRIGGRPAFLTPRPPALTSSHCGLCAQPMPLLVQMWCPFEGSAMDRVLYVWNCERAECQRKDSSIRAWRGLQYNPKYAAKLAKKKAREMEKTTRKAAELDREKEQKKSQSVNPFSLSAGAPSEMACGLGTRLFSSDTFTADKEYDEHASGSESESNGSDDESINAVAEQLRSTTLEHADHLMEWYSSPSYKPIYLSTVSEYLPSLPKPKVDAEAFVDEEIDENKKAGKDWGLEGWEKGVDVDGVFEKFVKRVSNDNEQCVRYDLNGTPLPFGSRGQVYDRLFPSPPPAPFTTKPGFAAPIVQRRTYDLSAIDKCGACGSRRIFECQLMPNLINVLKAQNDSEEIGSTKHTPSEGKTEEERRKELEVVLKAGIEWGTCFIFSCERDCCVEGDEGWKEELVLVQWDE